MRKRSQVTGRYQGAWVDLRCPMDCPDPEVTMPRFKVTTALVLIALVGASIFAVPALAAKAPRPSDPCDKELSVDDVQGILIGKAKINHYSMSESNPGEGCSLGVTGSGWAFVDISIRQGDMQSFQTYSFLSRHRANPSPGSATRPLALQRRTPMSPTPKRPTCTRERANCNALSSCIGPMAMERSCLFRQPMARLPPSWALYAISSSPPVVEADRVNR